ncbi:NAD(P)H-dependent oxidoreductase [Methanobacterium spitsbergense]|uniref:NAD(P)H-dependent oxidoreductase n=1 Tax=Methanobacterium spitsbergense TaxID=2874285 RepID=A0A8T5ULH9_9EURY|nr:NAD(P)H-dependent oxidoreductase [Methanobacterium spitsbergense]
MKIGIIIHSQTEHTYSVAQKLQDKLLDNGHETNLERVITIGDTPPGSKDIQFKNLPDVNAYDALIFGAPVQAFSLSKAMNGYMQQITSLQSKKVACFVTKGAPFKWTGGTRAIGQMKKICQTKGGIVIGTGIVIWRKDREKQINDLINKFGMLFEL